MTLFIIVYLLALCCYFYTRTGDNIKYRAINKYIMATMYLVFAIVVFFQRYRFASYQTLLMAALLFAYFGDIFLVFDFDNDYKQLFPSIGESSNDSHDGDFTDVTTATIGDISFTVTPAESGTANRIWGSSPRLRLYSGTFTIESAGEPITYIKFTGNTNWNVTADNGTLSGKEWAGNSNKIIFTVSKNTQIGQVEVSTEEGHVLKESLYSIAFTASQDGWSIDDKNLGGLTYVWKPSSSYGYVATAYTDACYETESWLLSPGKAATLRTRS